LPRLRQLPQHEFKSRRALRRWLAANHDKADAFWLVTCKKHKRAHVPYGDVVEELLCYGWIDSRTRRLDDDRMMLLVAPRKPGSTWSRANKRRVTRLDKAGLMTAAGRAKIDIAKKDGSWTFLDDVEALIVPDDLVAALRNSGPAQRHFELFSNSAKKIILLWIKTAKRDSTRAERISETVRLAAKNVKAAHPEARGH
jgi:uncharacterized protein YdeI (YjbR/CyaY-like superfamily)